MLNCQISIFINFILFIDTGTAVHSSCQPSWFRCGTGECVQPQLQCNSVRDCFDGSDEDGCSGKLIN